MFGSFAPPFSDFSGNLLDSPRHLPAHEAELGGLEGVLLRHRVFGAVQAVEDELAEERVADFAVAVDVVLALVIDEVEVVAFEVARRRRDICAARCSPRCRG